MIGFKGIAVLCALALTAMPPVSFDEVDEVDEVEEVEEVEEIDDEFYDDADEGVDQEDDSSFSDEVTVRDLYDVVVDLYNTVSGNSLVDDVEVDGSSVVPYADYSSYWGLFSSDYYNYFSGFLSKLSPNDHYVASMFQNNNNNNNYLFAWGEDLTWNGSYFVGTDVNVVTYTNSNYTHTKQSSFSFRPNNSLCYSDLTTIYPALSTPGDTYLRIVLYCFAFVFVFYVLTKFVVFRSRTRRRKLQ